MARFILRQISQNQSVKDMALEQSTVVTAEPGATYRLIDAKTLKPVPSARLKRKGNALVVEADSEVTVVVERFYGSEAGAVFEASEGGGPMQLVTEATALPELSAGAAESGAGAAATAGGGGEPLFAALVLGGLGILSSSGGVAAVPVNPSGGVAPAPVNNTVVAKVVGGPVVNGNDLQAMIYAADGTTLLGQGEINGDGTVTVKVGAYTGVVIVKVQNPANNIPDYMDEATGNPKDLGDAVLFSMGEIVTLNGVITLNVNILTALAYHEASQVAQRAPLTATLVHDTNAAVAKAFGLESLTEGEILTIVDQSGNALVSNTYGKLLAALSGADENNNGSVKATLDALIQAVSLTGNTTATVNQEGVNLLTEGAKVIDPNNSKGMLTAVQSALQSSTIIAPPTPPVTPPSQDTTAPIANFGGATDDVGSVTGALISGSTTDDMSLALWGTCEAGSTVTVYNYTNVEDLADVTGTTWSYLAALNHDYSYSFNVTETDAAGNLSEPTPYFRVTGDTRANTVGFYSANDDVGSVQGDVNYRSRTDDTSIELTGNVYNATVKVYNGTEFLGTAIANGDGQWTYTATVEDGITYNFKVTSTDAAGNTSAPQSYFYPITVDTTAPTANLGPVIDDFGSVQGVLASGATTDYMAVYLSGTCEAGSTVRVYDGTTFIKTAVVTGTTWRVQPSLSDGVTHQFSVTETDIVGNVSAPTSPFMLTGDISRPKPIFSAITDDVGSVTGVLDARGEATTDDPSLVLSGTCEEGGTVKVYDQQLLLGTATVTGTTWTYTATVAAGRHRFNIQETDIAGNSGAGVLAQPYDYEFYYVVTVVI